MIMKIFFGKALAWDPLRKLSGSGKRHPASSSRPQPPPQENSFSGEKQNSGRVTQKELDYLLDKLSEHGINSLSDHELERLRQARKQMRGEE